MALVAYGAGEAWGGVSVDYDLTERPWRASRAVSSASDLLVTGASRGVGAEVATQLADPSATSL